MNDSDTTKIDDGKVLTDSATVARFADDAVIFVHDKDGVKVVSGKTVNNWGETTVTSAVGLADKTNGVYYISIGAVEMTGTAKDDANAYGFVLNAWNETIDGTKYTVFEMWDGQETAEVKVEGTSVVAKYDFVSFDWKNQEAKEADKDEFDKKDANETDAVAITAFSKDDISFSDDNTLEFADTYFVIGVDTKGGTSSDANTLKTAKTVTEGTYANAIYFTTQDGDKTKVECVFIDVNGSMYTDKNGEIVYAQ